MRETLLVPSRQETAQSNLRRSVRIQLKKQPEPLAISLPSPTQKSVNMDSTEFLAPVTPSTLLKASPILGKAFRFPEEFSVDWDGNLQETLWSPTNMLQSPKDFSSFFSSKFNF